MDKCLNPPGIPGNYLRLLRYCQKEKGLDVYSYCIMTNHLHLIIGSETNELSDIVRDFKAYTSREIRKLIEAHSGESRKSWMLFLLNDTVVARRYDQRGNVNMILLF